MGGNGAVKGTPRAFRTAGGIRGAFGRGNMAQIQNAMAARLRRGGRGGRGNRAPAQQG